MSLPALLGGGRWRLLAGLAVSGAAQAAASLAMALAVREAFAGPGWRAAGAVAAAALGLGLMRAWERVGAERLGQAYVVAAREGLFRHLVHLAPAARARPSRGGVVLRLVHDLGAVRLWLTQGLARLVVAGMVVAGALAAMGLHSPRLALAVGAVLVAGGALQWRLGPGLRRATRAARRARARLATEVGERAAALAVIQAFGQWRRERARVRRRSRDLAAAMVRRARHAGALRGTAEVTAGLAWAALVLVGGAEMAAGRLAAGDLVAGLTLAALLAPRVRELGRVHEYWQGARVARERLEAFLALPARAPGRGRALPAGGGRVRFEGVRVGTALAPLEADVAPGRVVALVGPNGAGKSTLIGLVNGMAAPDAGRVLLDGVDVAEVAPRALRAAVSVLAPDLPLLRGTVRRNVLYRAPAVGEGAYRRLAARVGLAAAGRDGARRVGEGGRGLSAGERQRAALARALAGGCRVLLLDEPEGGLDAEGIEAVAALLRERPCTVLLATHRRELAALADEVWLLEAGRVVARGRPAEVLAAAGRWTPRPVVAGAQG
ncbi:ATP-binding cassette domain-containing protein [Inmirania thermothiophila]|uniref:ATP-binding cassette subfamily B protein n=1 Tax=Inmirania thermothiophila TaxID=1750597 RepID=A0A3N1Y1V4_9GAMM|nr:ABC transporter ATP-binding protein [Inmirania thermothiophila]ROR32800.1 ATP-binding cassette subfamily B protein [Inmirania thermothiophila]